MTHEPYHDTEVLGLTYPGLRARPRLVAYCRDCRSIVRSIEIKPPTTPAAPSPDAAGVVAEQEEYA
jgi:hypothetical protein